MLLEATKSLLSAAAETSAKAEPPIPIVIITGLSLVFVILLIIILVIVIQGKIFTSLDKRKAAKAKRAEDLLAAAAVTPSAVSAVPPAVEPGISPEIVAAITAAVHAASGGAYTLRAVSTVKKGRGSWGLAGVIQSTEPF